MTEDWKAFWKRIWRPFTRLWKSPSFFFYFFLAVCFFGALGTWVSAGRLWYGSESADVLSVYNNLATYIISIAVTAFADYFKRPEENNVALGLFLLTVTGLSVLGAIVVLATEDQGIAWWILLSGGFGAAWVWLNVHDSDPGLIPDDPYSSLGGEAT